MKISKLFVALAGVGLGYEIWAIIYSTPQMNGYKAVADGAQSVLNDANARLNAANNEYTQSQSQLSATQASIVDAECFISKYPMFSSNVDNYCAEASQSSNVLNNLKSRFGIEIRDIQDGIYRDHRTDSKRACGYEWRKDKYEWACHTIYYDVLITILDKYGSILGGPGSQSLMECRSYKQGLSVSAYQFLKQVSKQISPDKKKEDITNTYSSKLEIARYNDGVNIPTIYELNPDATNLSAAAIHLLSLIEEQCKKFNSLLQQPAHYQEIINNLSVGLPRLHAEVLRTEGIFNNATAYKNAKQKVFDIAESDLKSSQGKWVPALILPALAWAIILFCMESRFREKNYAGVSHFDTEKPLTFCFKPKCYKSNAAATRRFASQPSEAPTPISSSTHRDGENVYRDARSSSSRSAGNINNDSYQQATEVTTGVLEAMTIPVAALDVPVARESSQYNLKSGRALALS